MIYFILFLIILFWGIAPIFDKLGIKFVDVLTGIFCRNLTVTLLFTIIYFVYSKIYKITKIYKVTNPVGILYFILSGILADVLGALLYFITLKKLDASIVAPVVATYPLVTAIAAAVFLNEQLSLLRIIGILLTILGIWLITIQK